MDDNERKREFGKWNYSVAFDSPNKDQAARGALVLHRLVPAPDHGAGFRRDPETGFVYYSSEWLSDEPPTLVWTRRDIGWYDATASSGRWHIVQAGSSKWEIYRDGREESYSPADSLRTAKAWVADEVKRDHRLSDAKAPE